MPYVITQNCCNDASCVQVCPVDCIHPAPDEPGFGTVGHFARPARELLCYRDHASSPPWARAELARELHDKKLARQLHDK